MKIRKIHMIDFKRFHDLTIDLGENPKRIVALVGPNGSGKSSVFDAIIFPCASIYGRLGGPNVGYPRYHSLNQEYGYDWDRIVLNFDEGTLKEVYQARSRMNTFQTILSFRSSFRNNNLLFIDEISSMDDITFNNYGASTASDIDQKIEQSYRRILAAYNQYRDKNDVKPSEAKEHTIGELNVILQRCLGLSISSLGDVESSQGTLYFRRTDSDVEFTYNVLSSGEKEVVDILIDLFLRRDTYADSIYIIDEPELHLNTAIQRALLVEINKIVPQNCQIWIATHSIGFIRALQEELKDDSQIIEFKAENKWASEAYTLTPSKPSRQMWQSLFATALDDISALICPTTIVYCEGRADPGLGGLERGLDGNVYNTIFVKKYPDIHFISSGGNTELDQRSGIVIAILSKVFPSLEILVLKDRDMASGKVTDESDRQTYLNEHQLYHRVLKRFEIENYLYDKEILKLYCEKENLVFDEKSYDSFVHDICNDNIKDQHGRVRSCCGITTSISAEKLKLNLAACIGQDTSVYKELEEEIFLRQ